MALSLVGEKIKKQLSMLKANGYKAVSINGLEVFLDDVSREGSDDTEMQFTLQQSTIEQYKEDRAEWRELFKATVGYAQSAIKLQAFINGGAAIALLAFIGKIWTPEFNASPIANYIPLALVLYCYGVGAAAFTQFLAYISQHCFTYDREKIAIKVSFVANLTAFSSLVLFFVATYFAYLGFVGL